MSLPDPPAPPPATTPGSTLARALGSIRVVPALLGDRFTCIADTVAIGTFMVVVTLSTSGLVFGAPALVLAITLPAPARWRQRATWQSSGFGVFLAASAVTLACALRPTVGEHVSALPVALGAGLMMRATRAQRLRVTGVRELRWAPVAWRAIRERPVPAYHFVAGLARPNAPERLIAAELAEMILRGTSLTSAQGLGMLSARPAPAAR